MKTNYERNVASPKDVDDVVDGVDFFGIDDGDAGEFDGFAHAKLLIHKELCRPAVSGCLLAFVCLAGRYGRKSTGYAEKSQGETCEEKQGKTVGCCGIRG